jgi:hypothetical protein
LSTRFSKSAWTQISWRTTIEYVEAAMRSAMASSRAARCLAMYFRPLWLGKNEGERTSNSGRGWRPQGHGPETPCRRGGGKRTKGSWFLTWRPPLVTRDFLFRGHPFRSSHKNKLNTHASISVLKISHEGPLQLSPLTLNTNPISESPGLIVRLLNSVWENYCNFRGGRTLRPRSSPYWKLYLISP